MTITIAPRRVLRDPGARTTIQAGAKKEHRFDSGEKWAAY